MSPRPGLVCLLCLAAVVGGFHAATFASPRPYCDAVEACALEWEYTNWWFQEEGAYDGEDALQTVPIGDNESAVLSTTVTGPAAVSFWAKVSSEEDKDFLRFSVNGDVLAEVSGEMDWTLVEFDLPEGVHALVWTYSKDASGSAGADAALLDRFIIAPTGGIVVNGNAAATGSADVTLGLSWADGSARTTRMRFSNNGATWSPWEPLAAAKAWTLPVGDGYKTVRAQYRDVVGTVSERYSDYVKLDTTPPTGSILINGGASTVDSLNVMLDLTWNDGAGSGVSRMRFSDNGSTWSPWEAVSATKAWTLPGWGYRTVRVQFLDRMGSVSAVYNDYIKAVTGD